MRTDLGITNVQGAGRAEELLAPPHEPRSMPISEIRARASDWKLKDKIFKQRVYDAQGDANREFWARTARARYAEEKAKQGKTVRSYKRHARQFDDYSGALADVQRQMHRDRQRTYRGKDADSIRPYSDLTHLSAEEIADHKRKQAADRKRRQRAKEKAAKLAAVAVTDVQ